MSAQSLETVLLVVRHGQSVSNAERRFAGHQQSPLTDHGRCQALALAARLRDAKISRVFSSDLDRAYETAKILAEPHGVSVEMDSRLREMYFGQWEGKTETEIVARWPEHWKGVFNPHSGFSAPDGESLYELRVRIKTIYQEIINQSLGKLVLMVTHGNAIGALLADCLGVSYANSWVFQVSNCGLTRILIQDSHAKILVVNDTEHLDPDLNPKFEN